MVNAAAAANPRTIVVVTTPGAALMPWARNVSAIVVNFMPGQEAGNALADVLFGDVNPSARLPVTMPNIENEVNFTQSQYPVRCNRKKKQDKEEGGEGGEGEGGEREQRDHKGKRR